MPTVTIPKLEAARNQLDTALELWFHEKDVCSIHTLASAAFEIVQDIAKKKKLDVELLYTWDYIKPEFHKQWAEHLRKSANFLKHGNKDPDGVIAYDPDEAIPFMISAAKGIQSLIDVRTDSAEALMIWLALNKPHWVKATFVKIVTDSLPVEGILHLQEIKRSEFLEAYLKLRGEMRDWG